MLPCNSTYNSKSLGGERNRQYLVSEERMALPSHIAPTNWRLQPDLHDDNLDCLKPRKERQQRLYPSKESLARSLPDLSLDQIMNGYMSVKQTAIDTATDGSSGSSNFATKNQKTKGPLHAFVEGKPAAKQRSSISSDHTVPTIISDCSTADLEAINAAMYQNVEEDEERSKEMVQQLLREELGLPPAAQAQEGESKEALRTRVKSATQDLIYQLCLQLDDVQGNVKSDGWQMLAQHEINKLEVVSYSEYICAPCGSACDEKCMICQQDYQQDDMLRKLRCGHCFHRECVDPWLLQQDMCPVCRKTIDAE